MVFNFRLNYNEFMKKLLMLLLAILSFNSYGETFVCTYLHNGSIETVKYQRQGNVFIESMSGYDVGFKVPIFDESADYLALLQNIPGLGISSSFIDKNTKEFSSVIIRARMNTPSHGKCDVVY